MLVQNEQEMKSDCTHVSPCSLHGPCPSCYPCPSPGLVLLFRLALLPLWLALILVLVQSNPGRSGLGSGIVALHWKTKDHSYQNKTNLSSDSQLWIWDGQPCILALLQPDHGLCKQIIILSLCLQMTSDGGFTTQETSGSLLQGIPLHPVRKHLIKITMVLIKGLPTWTCPTPGQSHGVAA